MKIYSLFVWVCILTVYACTSKPKQTKPSINVVDSPVLIKETFIKGDPENEKDSLPNKRFRKSEIISCSFKKEALFGIWTTSNDNPACDFKLDEKEFFFCDYDGDGSRFYKVEKDTIFLDNAYVLFKGLIVKATGDTLVIHWQENEQPETLLRWKDDPKSGDHSK